MPTEQMELTIKLIAHTLKANLSLRPKEEVLICAQLLTAAHDVIAKTNHTSHRGASVCDGGIRNGLDGSYEGLFDRESREG